jgi:hypothetical protein
VLTDLRGLGNRDIIPDKFSRVISHKKMTDAPLDLGIIDVLIKAFFISF